MLVNSLVMKSIINSSISAHERDNSTSVTSSCEARPKLHLYIKIAHSKETRPSLTTSFPYYIVDSNSIADRKEKDVTLVK